MTQNRDLNLKTICLLHHYLSTMSCPLRRLVFWSTQYIHSSTSNVVLIGSWWSYVMTMMMMILRSYPEVDLSKFGVHAFPGDNRIGRLTNQGSRVRQPCSDALTCTHLRNFEGELNQQNYGLSPLMKRSGAVVIIRGRWCNHRPNTGGYGWA